MLKPLLDSKLLTGTLLTGALFAGTALALDDDGYGKKKDAYEAKPMTAEQRTEVAEVFGQLIKANKAMTVARTTSESGKCCSDKGACEPCETMSKGGKALVKYLVKQPESWEVVTPLVRDAFAADATSDEQRDYMLQILGWTKSKRVREVGEVLWKEAPSKFTENHVLAFAENGCDTLFNQARKLVKTSDSVRPAALVAMHSLKYEKKLAKGYKAKKPDAKPIDEKAVARDLKMAKKALVQAFKARKITHENAFDVLLAGTCLEELGQEGALREAQGKVHSTVIAALDAGELERAREMTLVASFVNDAAKKGAWQISYMDQRLDAHCSERSKEVATADQVFELIERVTSM
ncbi:MAG: hypothetical protein GY711_14135 [bacterium]|nr:hypothetical protein [bacterium]